MISTVNSNVYKTNCFVSATHQMEHFVVTQCIKYWVIRPRLIYRICFPCIHCDFANIFSFVTVEYDVFRLLEKTKRIALAETNFDALVYLISRMKLTQTIAEKAKWLIDYLWPLIVRQMFKWTFDCIDLVASNFCERRNHSTKEKSTNTQRYLVHMFVHRPPGMVKSVHWRYQWGNLQRTRKFWVFLRQKCSAVS